MNEKNKKVLSDKCTGLKPSGIRKFFDIVSEMKDAISLGVGFRSERTENGNRFLYEADPEYLL